ncbi:MULTISPECIES: NAD(P)H-dependent oxidoreductase [Devosia]|uniref:FMN-dependent NADPH-azoreductase n=1 Tax=Devosia equisanguinis TaxID=2490941 RepID=A0A447IE97_9HYPH|nr:MULTISPECIES: NAD(P)H-dependent oxidoreductase [Devosia]ODT50669.1 MAG: FMN reductase [Pelagibacterium sp. SCN 63-126]ODU85270.1 MAG: FMN reductase [Pelagibacterium sp. SCN 63-17]OJX45384.1 MAG: FMN reductase [Devosia sp. 63-57]VDS05817.1 FMN-dependent NADPH-azoreductase [Devosia equisanguinis]
MSKLKIGVIISSTRPTRFGEIPAQWILEKANERPEIDAEIVDLRDFNLPFFDEVASNAWAPSQNPEAVRWQKKIGEFDGFIFVVAEYNRAITGALKNAIDQAYVEWNKKAFGAVGYGSVGGARAVENLRTIGVELQMVSTRSAVHLAGGDFFSVHPGFGGTKTLNDLEASIGPSAKDMLDQLIWWGNAAKAARAAE